MTKNIKKNIPTLYSQENTKDPIVYIKFFCPWNDWTWYATEFDGQDMFFGWVFGNFPEMGYFRLSDLQSVRGPIGLGVERDLHFNPTPLSECKRFHL